MSECSLSRPEEVRDLAWVSRILARGKRGDINYLGWRELGYLMREKRLEDAAPSPHLLWGLRGCVL